MTLAFARAYYEHHKIEQEISELKKNKERLEAKRLETLELLEYVQSPGFIEQKARTELSMSRPGERVVVVTSPTSTITGQAHRDVVQEEEISNPMRWWRYFFHNNKEKN